MRRMYFLGIGNATRVDCEPTWRRSVGYYEAWNRYLLVTLGVTLPDLHELGQHLKENVDQFGIKLGAG